MCTATQSGRETDSRHAKYADLSGFVELFPCFAVLVCGAETEGRKRLRCGEKRLTDAQTQFLLTNSAVYSEAYACGVRADQGTEVRMCIPFHHGTVDGWFDAVDVLDGLLLKPNTCTPHKRRDIERHTKLRLLAIHMADFFGRHALLSDLIGAAWTKEGRSALHACLAMKEDMERSDFLGGNLVTRVWSEAPMWSGKMQGACRYSWLEMQSTRLEEPRTRTLLVYAEVLLKLPEVARDECVRALSTGMSYGLHAGDLEELEAIMEHLTRVDAVRFMDYLHTVETVRREHDSHAMVGQRYRIRSTSWCVPGVLDSV